MLTDCPRNNLTWKLFSLLLTVAACSIWPQPARAITDLGTTTVYSIGHSFTPPNYLGPPQDGYVVDDLVNQAQNVGGGAVLPSVTVDLDSDTGVSYTIAAPQNYEFSVNVPAGNAAWMIADLGWQIPAPDSIGNTGYTVTFNGLVGTAPSFADDGFGVGNQDRAIALVSETPSFSNSFRFSAVTFTTTYSPRNLMGGGTLTYQPLSTDFFQILYPTTASVDPGPFVSLVPVLQAGDFDFNGRLDTGDVTELEAALADPSGYYAALGLLPNSAQLKQVENLNSDDKLENADLQALLNLLRSGIGASTTPVPEPTSFLLLATGSLLLMLRRGRVLFVHTPHNHQDGCTS
jgi:hypothetical protein